MAAKFVFKDETGEGWIPDGVAPEGTTAIAAVAINAAGTRWPQDVCAPRLRGHSS
jgi:hypothetical protein